MQNGKKKPLVVLPTGCHALGEKVLMSDGTVRAVENVNVGDYLMGDDGEPRTVLHKSSGTAELYQIIPIKGDPFIVTGDHKLTLVQIGDINRQQKAEANGKFIKDVRVSDWLTWKKSTKHVHKLMRSDAIESFGNNKPLPLSPYVLGVLLGDGGLKNNIKVTNSDFEIINKIDEELSRLGSWLERDTSDASETYNIKSGVLGCKGSELHKILLGLGVRYCGAGDKEIPFDYKTADKKNRLQILAGILDTDGHMSHSGYDFISKSEQLSNDVVFIARSLGLAAYAKKCRKGINGKFEGEYYRVYISGDCSIIPCCVSRKKAPKRQQIKNVLHTGFSVKPVGVGEYCGFTVDKNNRYLLDDFTITHNSGKTVCFAWLAKATQDNNKIVWFLVHRRELLDQTLETFKKFKIKTESIYIGMVGQVANNADKFPAPDLIIFDEAHHAAAGTWRKITDRFPESWVIGLTATPCRLDGKPLKDVFDDLVVGVSTYDLIEQGFLSNYKFYSVKTVDLSGIRTKGSDYDMTYASAELMQRAVYGDVINTYKKHANGLQAICFCTTVIHSKATADAFNDAGIKAVHFDGNTSDKKRKEIIAKFRASEIDILCNVELVGEGFDMPACDCVIQLRPTQSLTIYLQQVGRALRPRKGKTAIILDHVGNVNRHGLPDDDRAWSLSEKIAERRQFNKDGTLAVRTCTECFACYPSAFDFCTVCGAQYQTTREEIKNIEFIELMEIERKKQEAKEERIKNLFTEKDCKNYSDFYQLAKKTNIYNPRQYAIGKCQQRGYWYPGRR